MSNSIKIQLKYMAGLGIKPGTPATVVRSYTTELLRLISSPFSLIYYIPPTLHDLHPRRSPKVLPLAGVYLSVPGKVMTPNVLGKEWAYVLWKHMVLSGFEPGTPATLVWSSTTELRRLISTVHTAQYYIPHSLNIFRPQRHVQHKFTLSGLINHIHIAWTRKTISAPS